MCTLTWRWDRSGYEVFFNRDELHTRAEALPPAAGVREGVCYLAPRDVDGGGTWILANELGFTCALLNYYDRRRPEKSIALDPKHGDWTSRGHLVMGLAGCGLVEAARATLERKDLRCYRPFLLAAFDAERRDANRWLWDGASVSSSALREDEQPLTTSSYRSEEVCSGRRAQFQLLGNSPEAEQLKGYHLGVDPADGAFSVRMRRVDAQTVSFSRVAVTDECVRFSYRPEKRDSFDLMPDVVLTLKRAARPATM